MNSHIDAVTHGERTDALSRVREIHDSLNDPDNRVAYVVLSDGSSVVDVVSIPPTVVDAYRSMMSSAVGRKLVAFDVHGGTRIGGPTQDGAEYREPYRLMRSLSGLSMPMSVVGPMLWARRLWYAVIADGDWSKDERWKPPGADDHYAPPPRDLSDEYDHAYAWRRLPAYLLRKKIREDATSTEFLERLINAEMNDTGGRRSVRETVLKEARDRMIQLGVQPGPEAYYCGRSYSRWR